VVIPAVDVITMSNDVGRFRWVGLMFTVCPFIVILQMYYYK